MVAYHAMASKEDPKTKTPKPEYKERPRKEFEERFNESGLDFITITPPPEEPAAK